MTAVTNGSEVRALVAVYNSELVFYLTADFSYETHLYVVSLKNTTQVKCVSCEISDQLIGTELYKRECRVASTAFSQSCEYISDNAFIASFISLVYSSLFRTQLLGT